MTHEDALQMTKVGARDLAMIAALAGSTGRTDIMDLLAQWEASWLRYIVACDVLTVEEVEGMLTDLAIEHDPSLREPAETPMTSEDIAAMLDEIDKL